MKQEDLLRRFRGHQPIVVNYGKGSNGKDIKEPAYWDEEKGMYESATGYWDIKLLIEIVQGKVEGTTLEVEDAI